MKFEDLSDPAAPPLPFAIVCVDAERPEGIVLFRFETLEEAEAERAEQERHEALTGGVSTFRIDKQ